MCVYLCTKFQVSSISQTSFRPGEGLILPRTSKQTPKESTQIRVKMKKEKLKVFKATNKKTFASVF